MTITPALATFSCMQCLVLCSSCFASSVSYSNLSFSSCCHAFPASWHPKDRMQSSCLRLPFQHRPCESGLLSLHQPRGCSYPPCTGDGPTPSFFFSLPQPSYNPHLLCCFLHFLNQAPLTTLPVSPLLPTSLVRLTCSLPLYSSSLLPSLSSPLFLFHLLLPFLFLSQSLASTVIDLFFVSLSHWKLAIWYSTHTALRSPGLVSHSSQPVGGDPFEGHLSDISHTMYLP